MVMFKDRLKYLLLNNKEMELAGVEAWSKENRIVEFLQLVRYLRGRALMAHALVA